MLYRPPLRINQSKRNVLAGMITQKTESKAPTQMAGGRREKLRRITTQESVKLKSFHKLKCVDDFSACNVLIVDDNMSNRFVLKALLKKCGYNSIEAQDGADAVNVVGNYIRKGTIKELLLIFMDLQMPIMDGIESTKAIIALCAAAGYDSPPIIGVSSDPSEEDRCKFELAGINEFVSKPLDKAKVNSVIRNYMEKS